MKSSIYTSPVAKHSSAFTLLLQHGIQQHLHFSYNKAMNSIYTSPTARHSTLFTFLLQHGIQQYLYFSYSTAFNSIYTSPTERIQQHLHFSYSTAFANIYTSPTARHSPTFTPLLQDGIQQHLHFSYSTAFASIYTSPTAQHSPAFTLLLWLLVHTSTNSHTSPADPQSHFYSLPILLLQTSSENFCSPTPTLLLQPIIHDSPTAQYPHVFVLLRSLSWPVPWVDDAGFVRLEQISQRV